MADRSARADSTTNFILQQGVDAPAQESCPARFSALMFQPRVIGPVVVLSVVLQSPALFLVLSGVLWWNVIFPRRNLFDAIYNRTLGARPGAVRLEPAPAPRRFSQGMAGSFALCIGVLLLLHAQAAAVVLEAFFLLAVAALVLGRFCLGSFLYHLLRGRSGFALATLPWKPGASSSSSSTCP